MGSFSKAVQAETVVGPLRRGFRITAWQAEHSKLADDEIDKNLFDAGILIFEKANDIRARLKLTFSQSFKATTKIRAFAALANQNLCVIQRRTREAMSELVERHAADPTGAPLMAHEFAGLTLELPFGATYSPDEIVQATVDGVQVPLKRILEPNPDLGGNPEFRTIDWEEAQMDFNLGVLYSHIEGLWDDCLWNGYGADRNEKVVTFSSPDTTWQEREAISRTRYMSLANEFAVHAHDALRNLIKSGRLAALGPLRVTAVKRVGKRQKIKLATFDADSEAGQWLLTMRGYASEPYYTELLSDAQPMLRGASLNHLLTAWTVTVSASDVLLQEVDAMDFAKPDDPKTWLPNYAPVLQVGALARAVATASACSYLEATAIVEFLIFRGEKDQELWAQPLLPVSKEAVVPLFAAITSPNLRRLVDVWLRQLGVDLGLRGPAFEAHIRAFMRRDIEQSPLLAGSSSCLGKHLTFTPDGEREEEIDVVALIGDILIVGEAKCFLDPAEAKEIARHREKVLESVAQVKRKASAVARHKHAFRQRAAEEGLSIPEEFRVQPLVILNNAIHVGITVESVPIVDENILGVFFRGNLVELVLKEPNMPINPIRKRVLYSSPEEAAHVLPAFLAAPPQMEPLLKGIARRLVPIPRVTQSDWVGLFLAVSCVPKLESSAQNHVQPLDSPARASEQP
ncbi:MAG: hypothetical protein ACKVQT_26195 [Burkholderiales bacterium]